MTEAKMPEDGLDKGRWKCPGPVEVAVAFAALFVFRSVVRSGFFVAQSGSRVDFCDSEWPGAFCGIRCRSQSNIATREFSVLGLSLTPTSALIQPNFLRLVFFAKKKRKQNYSRPWLASTFALSRLPRLQPRRRLTTAASKTVLLVLAFRRGRSRGRKRSSWTRLRT